MATCFVTGRCVCSFTQEEANELDNEKASVAAGLSDEERTSEYFLVLQQLERTREEVCRVIQRPENCLPYIKVTPAVVVWCVAATVSCCRQNFDALMAAI